MICDQQIRGGMISSGITTLRLFDVEHLLADKTAYLTMLWQQAGRMFKVIASVWTHCNEPVRQLRA